MGNQRENNDELLFGLLSEKLYGHYCGKEEEHLSKEEEQAVINIMNSLQVEDTDDFDPGSSYKKFCEKYLSDGENVVGEKKLSGIEELLAEMESDVSGMRMPEKPLSVGDKILLVFSRVGKMRVVRRVAFAILFVAVMFGGMNIGTYATAKMGFFEFLSINDKGWSFMVTGEEEKVDMDDIDKTVFSSWEEVKQLEGMKDMLVPKWIPEGCELISIDFAKGRDKGVYKGVYSNDSEEKFQIVVEKYSDKLRWQFFLQAEGDNCEKENIDGKNVLWYREDGKITCFFVEDKCSYYVFGEIERETIRSIVQNIK